MRTNLSLDKEGFVFVIDGGLIGIAAMFILGLAIELSNLYWPEFKPFHAPIGTLLTGYILGMMFCRVAPVWKKEGVLKHGTVQTD